MCIRDSDTGADAAFNNAGTFRKQGSGPTTTTTVDVAFNNTGTVDVQTGILSFSKGCLLYTSRCV